jgi:RNA polymerase sigma-70 factor (ECF subfamily)
MGLSASDVAIVRKFVIQCQFRYRCLASEELDDLVQECLIKLWLARQSLGLSDDQAFPTHYLFEVTQNRLMDSVRRLTANKRIGLLDTVSLDAPVSDSSEELTLRDTLTASSDRDTTSSYAVQHDLQMDLERMSALLTPLQRELCRLIGGEGLTIKEASERLRVRRASLYQEMLRIRRVFEQHLLGDYLKD